MIASPNWAAPAAAFAFCLVVPWASAKRERPSRAVPNASGEESGFTGEGPRFSRSGDPSGGRRQIGTRSREARPTGDLGPRSHQRTGDARSEARGVGRNAPGATRLARGARPSGQGGHPALAKIRLGEGYPLFVHRGPAADRRVADRSRGREHDGHRRSQTSRRALGILAPRERACAGVGPRSGHQGSHRAASSSRRAAPSSPWRDRNQCSSPCSRRSRK